MARRWLPILRRSLTGAPESKGLAERVLSSSAGYSVPGVPYSSDWNVRRATTEGYEGNPLVYRAIEVICDNATKHPIVTREGDPDDGPVVTDDPTRLLYVLNRRANPWEISRILRHRLMAQFLLSSKGAFLEVVRTPSNRFGMLTLLDPDMVRIVPSATSPIASFEITTPVAGTSSSYINYLPPFDPAADHDSQPSSVLWVRAPHPLVMWEGMTPIQAAGLPIDLDRYARIYNRRFLQNDGRPGGMIAIKGNSSPQQRELIQAQFNGGVESAGRTTVIEADSVSYVDTSGSPRDLMWGELSKLTKSDIAIAFGVPESVLGDASGRTFDNADAEYAMFWEHRMEPLLRMLDDQLDILTGGYDDNLYLRHDLSKVWVLGRHKRAEADRAAADLDRGAISIDDYREIIGRERLEVPATQVLWIPANGKMAVGETPEISQEAAATPFAMVGGGSPPDDTATVDPGDAPRAIEEARGLRALGPGRDTESSSLTTREGKQGRPRPEGPFRGAAAR